MSARDLHLAVRRALVRDGWTITHDPLTLPIGTNNLFVDLGAQRLLAAERGAERIAVEIKSFISQSAVADIEQALGQYLTYRSLLRRQEPERELVLAVPEQAFATVFASDLGRVLSEDYKLVLLVFDPKQEVLVRWQR